MKTIVISMIGIGSILFVVMIQHTASKRMWSYERAETSLSSATVSTGPATIRRRLSSSPRKTIMELKIAMRC